MKIRVGRFCFSSDIIKCQLIAIADPPAPMMKASAFVVLKWLLGINPSIVSPDEIGSFAWQMSLLPRFDMQLVSPISLA